LTRQKFLGARIVLGVSGSIAAYKAVGLLRSLIQEGAHVSVVMTEAASRFVSPLTFEVLSRNPVSINTFAAREEMTHLSLPEQAQAIVVAPATANQLAKYATGLADDLLSTMALTASCPFIVAPAMDGGMWDHPAVQANVATLRRRGVIVLEPEDGPLASGKVGKGRLTEEEVILAALEAALAPRRDLVGQRILISAGPTQEAIDPVRFISNRSSGKMGYALAQAARERGAQVVLVTGPTALSIPAGVEIQYVSTAEDMTKAMQSRLSWSTVVIMAAAVADFRVVRPSAKKIKKGGTAWQHLDLEPTDDILTLLSQQRSPSQTIVGFAAETEAVAEHAAQKLKYKGLDLVVGNNVAEAGSGFGSDTSAAILIDREGRTTAIPVMAKRELADKILDHVKLLHGHHKQSLPEHI
jgi:phosphopantothenoylcysteine decarboxylase/phosphopantothenate--cysteine ligase